MRPPLPALPTQERDAAAIIARALRDPGADPPAVPREYAAGLIAAASHHRVLLLTGWTLRAAGALENWPPAFAAAFQRAEREAVALECVRHAELAALLADLSAAGARVIPFKGAALAHTHYPAPHVRVRADTDLLVAESDVPALEAVLGRRGYLRPAENAGRLVSYQSHYHHVDRHGVAHALDVHWRISNLQMLAHRLTFEELWQHRVPLAALGPSAVTVSDVHALLLALVHRAGHHPGSRNLLWLYDLHALAGRLTGDEMSQVQEIAALRGLAQIAADGLALVRDFFSQAALAPVVDALQARARHPEEAVIIPAPPSQAALLRLDLDALPGWRARGRLIREHLLPSPDYMRARYQVRSNLLLPGLYFWRALVGMPKWLRSRKAEDRPA